MTKKHRTQDQWEALFAEHAQSKLSTSKFCLSRGLNPNYFYTVKKRLSRQSLVNTKPKFCQVSLPEPMLDTRSFAQFQFKGVSLSIPIGADPLWVSQIAKGLCS